MTIRKFALVGDTHADAHHRLEEHNEVMKWIAWDAKGRGAQAMLHSGDVYERASNSQERDAVYDWVATVAGLMDLVIVAGNHDDPRDISALGLLRTVHPVHAEDRPGPIIPIGAGHGPLIAWIAALPWPRKAYLLAGETGSREDMERKARTALLNILRDYGSQFAGLQDETVPRILLAHAMVRGSKVGPTQPPLVGADFELGVEDLVSSGADLCALGHIHLGQTWEHLDGIRGNVTVLYPGSPLGRNFGELEQKSYTLLTFDDRRLVSVERIPTPARKLMQIKASFEVVDGRPEILLGEPLPEDLTNTEVQLRYEVPAESRIAARAASQELVRLMQEAGALRCHPMEVVKVSQRARAPEVAAARGNLERLKAHWASKGGAPERAQHILEKLIELEEDATTGVRHLGGLQFHRLTIKDLGPFATRVVEFDELDGKLIAVTGSNGAGKSTLLELLLGGIYRTCPTRGSLIDLATTREAQLELAVTSGGHRYDIKHLIDGLQRKSEAVILCDGKPAVESTKVKAVDAYVERHFPAMELLLVSTFAAQRSRGFLATKPAERKELLLRIRGVEVLKELAAFAREHATQAAHQLELRAQRIKDRRPRTSAAELLAQIAQGESTVAARRADLEAARQALEEGKKQNDARAGAEGKLREWQRSRDLLSSAQGKAQQALKTVIERLSKAELLAEREPQIRAAVERCERLRAEDVADAMAQQPAPPSQLSRLTEQLQLANQQIAAAKERLEWKPRVEIAVAALPVMREQADAARQELTNANLQISVLQGERLVGADDRIKRLRTGLHDVEAKAEDIDHARSIAGEALHNDDVVKARAESVPKKLQELEQQRREADQRVQALDLDVRSAERLAAKAELVAAAEQALATAEAEAKRLAQEGAAEKQRLTEAMEAQKKRVLQRDARAAELRRLSPEAALLPNVLVALEAIPACKATEAEVRAELAKLEAELEALGPEPAVPPGAFVGVLEANVRAMEHTLESVEREVWQAGDRLKTAQEAEAAIAEMERIQAGEQLEQADWARLAADLGKDGLQAALSDAVLPELVALTNTLLHSAFGPRFTVDVRSQAVDSTGKRMLETLDVWVIDTEAGREGLAETFSGGEETILEEALSLALTVLACRSSDGTPPTLVRDEAGAALDGERGRAWIAMLRRAVDMVGADRLLFVSHSPELTALADGRIEL